MKRYNINELLDKKKELEKKIMEKSEGLTAADLTYIKEEITDHTTNKKRDIIPKEKQTLPEFITEFKGIVEELSKIKTALQKYNAEKVLGKLQNREMNRVMNSYLDKIKSILPKDMTTANKATRIGTEGNTLESVFITNEPFFKHSEVEKMMSETSAEERKLNTDIQKENLNANIEL